MDNRKKILLVSSAFYPELSPRSFRATELAKEFFRQGHDVTVISKFRDHDYSAFLNEFTVTFKMWDKPTFPVFPDFRQKYLAFLFNGISRVLSVLFEYPAIEQMFHVRKILKFENGYDLIISFAVPYPVHWGVAWARSYKHRIAETWIADCGDPYMGATLDTFRKPFYFGYLERKFCRKADYISIPVESARPGYYSEFQYKIRIIPQGFAFSLSSDEKLYHTNTIPEFAYTGSFIKGFRDPEMFIKCLLTIKRPFKFHVFTNHPHHLINYQKALGDKLIISGYIPREELMKKLPEMDFLINFDNNTNLAIPSKLIDYAISGRPVLNVDKKFICYKLLMFLDGDYNNRMLLPDPSQYHIKNVSKLFLDLI